MTLFRKFVGQAFIYGTSYIFMRVLNYLLFSIYLSREFSQNTEYLAVNRILYGYIGFFVILLGLRMDTTYFKHVQDYVEKTFGSILVIFSSVILPLLIIALLFSRGLTDFVFREIDPSILPSETGRELVILSALIIAIDVFLILPFSRFRAQQQPIKFSAYKIMQVGLMLILFLSGLKFWPCIQDPESKNIELLRLVFYSNLIGSIVTLLSLLPIYWQANKGSSKSLITTMLRYAIPLVAASLSLYIPTQGVATVLELVTRSGNSNFIEDIGKYAGIAQFSFFLVFFNQAYNYAAEPFFFEQSKRTDRKKIYADMAYFYSLLSCILILFILFIQGLLVDYIGSGYTKFLYLLPLMLVGTYLYGMYLNFSIWYKLTSQTVYATYINGGGALLFILLATALIPYFGLPSMPFIVVATFLFICIWTLYFGRKNFYIPYPLGSMIFWLGLSITTFYTVQYFMNQGSLSTSTEYFIKALVLVAFITVSYLSNRRRIRKAFAKE